MGGGKRKAGHVTKWLFLDPQVMGKVKFGNGPNNLD